MKKILITGTNGQLGCELNHLHKDNYKNCTSEFNFIFTNKNSLDITNFQNLKTHLTKNKYDYIINCAAYTQVDKACFDKEQAYLINSDSINKIINHITEETKFIHISTDYVFDGNHYIPYKEDNITNPTSVYGKSKLKGEEYALSHNNSIIIRTSWLYSIYGNNFPKTMLKLFCEKNQINVVSDQIGTPTYARDLAKVIIGIIKKSEENSTFNRGIYHYSNEGACSWYDFALTIAKKTNSKCHINPIETKDYPTIAKRPFYSVLNKNKIKTIYNIEIPHWSESLDEFLKAIKE